MSPRPPSFNLPYADVFVAALDAIEQSAIIARVDPPCVVFANHATYDAGLISAGGAMAAEVLAAADAHRELRQALRRIAGAAPAQPFRFGSRTYYLRTVALKNGCELLWIQPQRLRDLELTNLFREAYSLTDRQADVLQHILKGRNTIEIAGVLRVKSSTVRRHQSDLLLALGVKSKLDIFRLAEQFRSRR